MDLGQTIGATFSNAVLLQAIGATFGDAVLLQTVGATFGKHVGGEYGEGEAENDLAFHKCVLRGVVGWYGADVTRHDF